MFDRTDVLWREEPTPDPSRKPARDGRPTVDQAHQVDQRPGAPGHHPRSPDPELAEQPTPREDTPEHAARAAYVAGLTGQDRAREERADQERDQLAAERQARITTACARLDAAAGTARQTAVAPDRQAREDGRTWTADRAWTDQARRGLPRCTTPTEPRPPTMHDARRERAEAHPRTGHRREYDTREAPPRRTRTDRDREAIADVGLYRAVSYTDLSAQHYDGHPYAARRAVSRMVRDGMIEEHEATGPQGTALTVLTATEKGRAQAHRAALDAGHAAEQQTWTGLVKPAELSHDTAVYRAALDERARLEAEGGRVVRVRLDAELKSRVATATETARGAGGDRAAETAKAAAAQELGLPMQDGHVLYPDAQLDIEDRDGMGGRVNVEIASDHYHAAAIVAKAGAGFAMHGSSPSASQKIGRALGRAAARETDSGPGGGSGAGRDGSVEL